MGLIDRVRAERERELAKPKFLDREVPGYGGTLVVRYRPIPWEETQQLLQRDEDAQGDAEESLAVQLDSLIRACHGLYVRDEENPERLVSLGDLLREQGEDVTGEVRFDANAVDALGLDVPTDESGSARQTVLAVFETAVSPELAVTRHADMIGLWMQGVSLGVDASVGEASSPDPS